MNHAKEEMRRMSLGRMESVFTSCSSVRETLSIWVDGWLVKGGDILRPWCVASEESVSEKGYSISGHSESSVEPCEMGWIELKYTTSASKPCLCALLRNVGYCACQWGGRFSSGLQSVVYRTLGVGVFCMWVYLYLHVCSAQISLVLSLNGWHLYRILFPLLRSATESRGNHVRW